MRSGTLKSVALLAASILIALAVAEVGLRSAFKLSDIYRGVAPYPELNQRRYEYLFLEDRADGAITRGNYDAMLGWDLIDSPSRSRGDSEPETAKPDGTLRVVAVGDSFTYGAEVAAAETFSKALEQSLCRSEVINMGVSGYGIGQAFLKYRLIGQRYRPDVVVFGIHPPNLERMSLAFFAAAKPVVAMGADGNSLDVRNQPVPEPAAELARIQVQASNEVRVLALMRNVYRYVMWRAFGADAFLDRMGRTTEVLLRTMKREVEDSGGRLLVLQIPMGEVFTTGNAWHDDMNRALLGTYERAGIDYIDLEKTWRAAGDPAKAAAANYVPRGEDAFGHLSVEGNKAAATLLAEKIKTLPGLTLPACQ